MAQQEAHHWQSQRVWFATSHMAMFMLLGVASIIFATVWPCLFCCDPLSSWTHRPAVVTVDRRHVAVALKSSVVMGHW